MSDDGISSAFNEGALQIRRINDLQDNINRLKLNPLMFNPTTQTYNYEAILTCTSSLLSEVWSKMSAKEKTEGEKIRILVEDFIKYRPVFTEYHEESFGNVKIKRMLNTSNWEDIKRLLNIFELRVREYLEEHDLTAPKQEEEGGWD